MTTNAEVQRWQNSWNATKYKPEYDQMLIDHLSQGLSLGSFNVPGGVSYRTLINWTKKYKSFAEARDIGEKARLELLEVEGIKMVKAGNVVAWKFLMNQHGMHEKVEVEHSGGSPLLGVPDSLRYKRLQKLKELHQKVSAVQKVVEGTVVDELEDL